MNVIKISDTEIQVTKTETKKTTNNFTLDYLLKQKSDIQAQKDRDNGQRDVELAEVQNMIDEAQKQGVLTGAEVQAVSVAETIIPTEPMI